MNKLLSAGFVRLRKNKTLWFSMIFMAFLGVSIAISAYSDYSLFGLKSSLGGALFAYGQFIGILSSTFSSLFLGTEYSDGTIRNKLIAGHKRITVYLSGLVLNLAAALLIILSFQLSLFLAGVSLLGIEFFSMGTCSLVSNLVSGLALSAAYCAVFTFISMLCQKRAVSAVIGILTSFILLFLGAYIMSSLSQPEYWDGYTLTSDTGEVVEMEPEPNPHYLRGAKRELYTFLFDFLPGSQSLRLSEAGLYGWQPPVYSLIITVFFSGTGILLFKKKDLN